MVYRLCVVGYGQFGNALLGNFNTDQYQIQAIRGRNFANEELPQGVDLVFLAIPGIILHDFFEKNYKKWNDHFASAITIIAGKGIVNKSMLAYDFMLDYVDKNNLGVIGGPNIAGEIIQMKPSYAVLAMNAIQRATEVSEMLNNGLSINFIPQSDVLCVQMLGIMKNIMSITMGAASFIGRNYMSKIFYECILDMSTICNPIHMAGIADLFLSASGTRNFKLGYKIAEHGIQSINNSDCMLEGYQGAHCIQNIIKDLPPTILAAKNIIQGMHHAEALDQIMNKK